jgi:hypothetical protein
MLTKPLRFVGDDLYVNYSTSAGGSLKIEIQDTAGVPVPGFSLSDCKELVGDAIEQKVIWGKGTSLSAIGGKPVRLRMVLIDADLFALQFRPRP